MANVLKLLQSVSRNRWLKRGALSLAVVVALVTLLGFMWERRARSAAKAAFPPPGQMVDVEGGPLHLNCTGQGLPSVMLDVFFFFGSFSCFSLLSFVYFFLGFL
jgi:hypothetical protein